MTVFKVFLHILPYFKSGALVFRSENKVRHQSLECMRHDNHIQHLNGIFLLKPLFLDITCKRKERCAGWSSRSADLMMNVNMLVAWMRGGPEPDSLLKVHFFSTTSFPSSDSSHYAECFSSRDASWNHQTTSGHVWSSRLRHRVWGGAKQRQGGGEVDEEQHDHCPGRQVPDDQRR